MSLKDLTERINSKEPKDCCIQIDLPDGRHWFYGIAEIGSQDGRMVMNDWRMDFADLEIDSGVWSRSECLRWLKYIATDGIEIVRWSDAKRWWLYEGGKKKFNQLIEKEHGKKNLLN